MHWVQCLAGRKHLIHGGHFCDFPLSWANRWAFLYNPFQEFQWLLTEDGKWVGWTCVGAHCSLHIDHLQTDIRL